MVGGESDVERGACVIEDDVWIGANVIILPGCRMIGTGAVIGAGAVVTKDVPQFAIVAGNPAKQIGERLSGDERTRLLAAMPWDLPPEEMRNSLLSLSEEGPA
jgi:acetyltransferase-like isoleucine patch superfamily enzyme